MANHGIRGKALAGSWGRRARLLGRSLLATGALAIVGMAGATSASATTVVLPKAANNAVAIGGSFERSPVVSFGTVPCGTSLTHVETCPAVIVAPD